jgi:hypothetical protein
VTRIPDRSLDFAFTAFSTVNRHPLHLKMLLFLAAFSTVNRHPLHLKML